MLIAGLVIAVVLLPFVTWGLALAGGWDAAALAFLLTSWPLIIRADGSRAAQLAGREDQTEGSARALLVGAGVASVLGAGYALHLAGREKGAPPAWKASAWGTGTTPPTDVTTAMLHQLLNLLASRKLRVNIEAIPLSAVAE